MIIPVAKDQYLFPNIIVHFYSFFIISLRVCMVSLRDKNFLTGLCRRAAFSECAIPNDIRVYGSCVDAQKCLRQSVFLPLAVIPATERPPLSEDSSTSARMKVRNLSKPGQCSSRISNGQRISGKFTLFIISSCHRRSLHSSSPAACHKRIATWPCPIQCVRPSWAQPGDCFPTGFLSAPGWHIGDGV